MDTTEATAPTETKAPPVPRGPSPENAARLDHILKRSTNEPGVASPILAKELGISTLSCSQLTDRLVRQGKLVIRKVDGGVRTNYPAGYDFTDVDAAAAQAKIAKEADDKVKAEQAAAAKKAKAEAAAKAKADKEAADKLSAAATEPTIDADQDPGDPDEEESLT
jgi:topoisomerase IA-like protein